MLVLGRKRFEAIRIGDDIRIVAVKIDRGHVRLGIEAPGGVIIVREELLLADDELRGAKEAWDADDPAASLDADVPADRPTR